MQTAGEKLVTHWQADGLFIQPGVTEDQFQAFEQKFHVTLPSDLRAYFLLVDGMRMTLDDYSDRWGFSFWPLKKIVIAQEELNRVSLAPTPPGLESYFVFVDYLQWSWAYAIYLSPDVTARNCIILIGKESEVEVASSFTEFVDLYIADSPILYG